jgi:hypothetical protein
VERSRTVRFDLSEEEFAEVGAAAAQAGLAKGAYAAQVVLSAARPRRVHPRRWPGPPHRRQLNQAVAKLNATGQRSGDLLPYAAESLRRARLLDQAAEEVRKRIRS